MIRLYVISVLVERAKDPELSRSDSATTTTQAHPGIRRTIAQKAQPTEESQPSEKPSERSSEKPKQKSTLRSALREVMESNLRPAPAKQANRQEFNTQTIA